MPALSQFLQRGFLIFNKGDLFFQPVFQDVVVDDVAAFDHEAPVSETINTLRRRPLTLAHHRHVVADTVRLAEIEIQVASWRIEHALQNIDLSGLQGFHALRPIAELDIDIQAHFAGDGTGQVHVEAGRPTIFVQKFEGRIIPVATNHNGAICRKLHGGKPLGVQVAVGAVSHHDGQPLVQQGQGRAVALGDGKTEVLSKAIDGPIDHLEICQTGFLNQAQGHQSLDHHRVIPPLGQILKGEVECGRGMDLEVALFSSQKLLCIVALHHGHPAATQIRKIPDTGFIAAHHDGPVQ